MVPVSIANLIVIVVVVVNVYLSPLIIIIIIHISIVLDFIYHFRWMNIPTVSSITVSFIVDASADFWVT